MKIPMIKKSRRNREYESYTVEQHLAVVEGYIFEGLSHRMLDEKVLGLNSEYSHGYQSMGILHYLGITGEFKGLFKGLTTDEAIMELKNTADISYDDLIAILSGMEISEIQCQEDIENETC